MKETFNLWLEDNTQLSVILACALRHPDREIHSLSYAPEFPQPACEEAWACMAEAQRLMDKLKMPRGRFCWSFQSARFYFGARRDGVCLGLITMPNPPAEQIEKIFADFQAIPAAA
ncbi:MAG: hypothetical protein HY301_15865 [Verrucomicrobia bacterium]|nr:hypothetical protein [Verrucomicrobiota bacterium]